MITLLRKVPINFRLWSMLVLTLTALLTVSIYVAYDIKARQLVNKKHQLAELINAAKSTVKYHEEQIQTGKLTREEAETRALSILNSIRGNQDAYLTVLTTDGLVLQHPHQPALVGQSLTQLKDINGKLFVKDIIGQLSREGQAVVDYFWQKPGSEKHLEKLSYAETMGYKNWAVMTGVWIDDLNAQHASYLFAIVGVMLITGGLLSIPLILISRSITQPVNHVSQAMAQIAEGNGDLTQRLPTSGNDEISKLSRAFNKFIEKNQDTIAEVSHSSHTLTSSSENLNAIVASSSAGFSKQKTSLSQVAHIIDGISERAEHVADNAKQAASMATAAQKETHQNHHNVQKTISAIDSMTKNFNAAHDVVNRLQQESENIGSVIDVIGSIAEQTNLLALNAAIEAARAGEQGRGFAVVADEVRTLASRTQESTQEINQMIERLQSGAKEATAVMENSHSDTENTLSQAAQTSDSLQNISNAIESISSMNQQISELVATQFSAVQEANTRIIQVTEQTENDSQTQEALSLEAEKLAQQGEALKQLIVQFRI